MNKKDAAPPTIDKDDAAPVPPVSRVAPFPIVGLGASAGGLEAMSELLRHLPLDTGMAFVLVQHLDPHHESALTQLLARTTKLPVHEVTDRLKVEPNHVYVIPPDAQLGIADGVLMLGERPRTRTAARSIDRFFEALAADRRERAIGVILSGTASDGTLGLEAIKAEGGITFAQDDSARFESMPRSAVAAGCVDFVLAPQRIAEELARIARHPYVAAGAAADADPAAPSHGEDDRAEATAHADDASPLPSGGHETPARQAREARRPKEEAARGEPVGSALSQEGFKKILLLLRNHAGVDFSLYKSSTIQRRITRRMVLGRHETLEAYVGFLRGNAKELDALYSDTLISVTSFFRNPEAFEVLAQKVWPALLATGGDAPVRVWVLGCSTGQEAYSIAMAFVEAAAQAPAPRALQVFATDLNDALLDKARDGLYARSITEDLSSERLRRFFVEEQGGYRVRKSLREMVVFARQNVIADPPFSRMDLISCRNLLIYFEPALQKKLFPTFHYALKPSGHLFLGASESIGGFTELFEPVDKKQKVYARKPGPVPALQLPRRSEAGGDAQATPERAPAPAANTAPAGTTEWRGAERSAQREADRITLNRFAPPGVLVNAQLQVLEFRGATGAFLEPPAGLASFDVLKMARPGLMLPLNAAITEARRENRPARAGRVEVKRDEQVSLIDVQVIPLKNLAEPSFLILFESVAEAVPGSSAPVAPAPVPDSEALRRIAGLEAELAGTRDYLESVQEQYAAANEELQASGEEAQSANEELQSINEELETSKEELESTNEELLTVNEEMVGRNAELNRLNADLVNTQSSAQLGIILLGRDLTIRRFSAQAELQFNLHASDIGRPLGNMRHRLQMTDLEALTVEVIGSIAPREREVQDDAGHWWLLRLRPYLTLDNQVDGAVLLLLDIDTLKRSEQALRDSDAQYRALFEWTTVGVCEAEIDTGKLLRVNERFARLLGYAVAEVAGKTFVELTHPDDRDANWAGFTRLVHAETASYEVEKRMLHRDGTAVWVHVTVNLVRDIAGRALRAAALVLDIGERRRAEEAAAHLAAIVTSSDDAIFSESLDDRITSWNAAAQRLFGYRADEIVGQPGSLLIAPDHVEDEPAMLDRIRRGEVVANYETVRRRKDGSLIDVSLTLSPVRDASGAVIGAAKIARDITESKRGQAALLEADRRKSEFLAMLAHELRNPLAPLRNALAIVRRTGEQAALGAAADSALQMMERQVTQMVRLVDDLLDVSRMSRGTIELLRRRVELAPLLREAIEAARGACDAVGIELALELPGAPVWLDADPARLAQILGNLMNNACKFTDRGGRIRVAAELDAAAGEVLIRVADSGIGIAADQLESIFGMFTQIDSARTRSVGGLGIGLALVRDLVGLHGGSINAASAGSGKGSEFTLRVPVVDARDVAVAPDVARELAAAPAIDGADGALRILVADDNRDAGESIADLLGFEGHETALAYDGVEAVEAVQRFRPDVALLDIGMPRLDGYGAARQIRASDAGKAVFLIALTGWGRDEDRVQTAQAGFDAHLVKPVEFDALLALLAAQQQQRVRR